MLYPTKSVLIYDQSTFVSLAERLARDFGKVMYFSPYMSSFPQRKYASIGEGLPGVERVNHFFDHVNEADLIVFPDVGDGDMQLELEASGYRVWGSRKGEELELDRVGTKKLLKKLNMPVGHYEVVIGMDELRKYLKTHKNIWVKTPIFRGDMETFQSLNYDYIEPRLNEIEVNLGALKNKMIFLCEDDLPDRVEIGYDGYCVDGAFPGYTLSGIEVKDMCYIGVFKEYDKIPEPIKSVNDKLSPILRKYTYRNFFSSEVRIGKDKIGYLTDPCCRLGSPPNEAYQEMYLNMAEIIYEGAGGKLIEPVVKDKIAVEALIHCSWAERNWLPILYPEKYANNIKLRNATMIDGVRYIVPQYVGLPEVGAVVATGDSMEECFDKITEIADQMKGFYIEVQNNSLDKAKEEIEKLKEFGYDLLK